MGQNYVNSNNHNNGSLNDDDNGVISLNNQKNPEIERVKKSEVVNGVTMVAEEKDRDDKTVFSCRKPEKKSEILPKELPLSNVGCFLEAITPSVHANYLSKTTARGLNSCEVETEPYFLLSDLWESFKEWSAYGVGVPLVLNDSDSVVQYYVPYLSGIQIYVDPSKSPVKPRYNRFILVSFVFIRNL